MHTPAGGFSAVESSPSRPPTEGAFAADEARTLESARPSAETSSSDVEAESAVGVDAEKQAEASLEGLEEAIELASAGLKAAVELKGQLSSELAEVRTLLGAVMIERDTLSARVEVLERQLEDALRESERSRDFLMNEQDTFIAGVLEEHEKVIVDLTRERDEALARVAAATPAAHTIETARPPKSETQRGLGAVTEPPPPLAEPSPDELEKVLADRERSRQLFGRLQAQRDEAQRELVARVRERDELFRELSKLAPERFVQKKPWSAADARRTIPAIPQVVAKTAAAPPACLEAPDEWEGDRVTAPPSEEAVSALTASRPSPPRGTATASGSNGEVGADGKPLLKRKPDPTQRPLGTYSLSGDEVADPEAPVSSVRNR